MSCNDISYTDNSGCFSRRGRHHEREKSHKRHSPRNKEHEEKFEAPPQPPPQQPLQYPPPPEAGLASMIDNHAKVRICIILKAVNAFSDFAAYVFTDHFQSLREQSKEESKKKCGIMVGKSVSQHFHLYMVIKPNCLPALKSNNDRTAPIILIFRQMYFSD